MNEQNLEALLTLIARQNETIIKSFDNQFKQTEALTALYKILKIETALPPTRGWAASPDYLLKITAMIFDLKPRLILEAGSGVSTMVAAQCLKQIGSGKIISLDHDLKYFKQTRDMINKYKLGAFSELIHAPITKHSINESIRLWYDISNLTIDSEIDLLIVDGPPGSTQKNARFPIVPLFYDKLKSGGTILLDDANRKDEQQTAQQWLAEYKFSGTEFLEFEKGAIVLVK